MKVKMTKVPQESKMKAGAVADLTGEELDTLRASGHEFVTEGEELANARAEASMALVVKAREAAVDGAIKASKAFAPKQDTKDVRAKAIKMEETEAGLGVQYIQGLPALRANDLSQRQTGGDEPQTRIFPGEELLDDALKGYLVASEPFQKTLRQGGMLRACGTNPSEIDKAVQLSRIRATRCKSLSDLIMKGADFRFADIAERVKAAVNGTDFADPAAGNPLGVLNTGLTLQWNLGYLAYQLAMIDDITTDISSTPVLFNQYARTRYIQVPKVMLKTSTNAWPNTGAPTGTDVDVNVLMDTHAGVPLSINNNVLSSTARQLMNEQKAPQLYGLGQYIIYKLINVINNGSTRIANDGTTTNTQKFNPAYTGTGSGGAFNVGNATLATFVADLPEAMDEAKMPGGDEEPGVADLQRFVWVHGRIYAAAAGDTNFILNQSIQGIKQNSSENLIETGRFLRIGNAKFRKSQLMSDQITVAGSGTDSTTNGITVTAGTYANATIVGMAGTRSSLLFVSRVPLDYSKIMPEIPSTAAIELVSEPKTGITFMVVKFLDHAYETANMRVQLMFGVAVGDERQGMLLSRQ